MRKCVTLVVAASLGVSLAGCSDFLTGPKLTDNPNQPTVATASGLLTAVQANLFVRTEADLARTVCVWMQQCSAQITYLSYGTYAVVSDGEIWYFDWAGVFGAGGLIDLRQLQQTTLANGDSLYAGVGAVLEAYLMGTAADVWGDIPYTQAADSTIAAPALDPQQEVYAHVQAKLDSAITFLAATGARNVGPGDVDLFYGGDATLWTELAHTLKARFHLHTAEVLGDAAYTAARDEALLGISDPANDFTTKHGTEITASNIWYQFTSTAAQNYIAAGKFQVDLLAAAGDPRLAAYYKPAESSGLFVGADPGEQLSSSDISTFADGRVAPDFPQPLVTYGENQLILAEASYRLGDEAAANDALDAAATAAEVTPPGTLSGAALLEAIMTEKYVELFQNIEVWSDYRRTCLPALVPFSGAPGIPARLPYPLSERNANPSITDPGGARNWNDPVGC
jgi:hypothetical protein